mmetsp:Transcript_33573/g.84543  ORF Transcript_33573/g.84543 Transcript_33573/m.84543 type:complete len:243 (+) Transcript_33573:796-1524(+)
MRAYEDVCASQGLSRPSAVSANDCVVYKGGRGRGRPARGHHVIGGELSQVVVVTQSMSPHLWEHENVSGPVAWVAALAVLRQVHLHLAHLASARCELEHAALVCARGGSERRLHCGGSITSRLLELLVRPLLRIAVHEEGVAVMVLHCPRQHLSAHLFAVKSNVLVGVGILVHRHCHEAVRGGARLPSRVAQRRGGDERIRSSVNKHAMRRALRCVDAPSDSQLCSEECDDRKAGAGVGQER